MWKTRVLSRGLRPELTDQIPAAVLAGFCTSHKIILAYVTTLFGRFATSQVYKNLGRFLCGSISNVKFVFFDLRPSVMEPF